MPTDPRLSLEALPDLNLFEIARNESAADRADAATRPLGRRVQDNPGTRSSRDFPSGKKVRFPLSIPLTACRMFRKSW